LSGYKNSVFLIKLIIIISFLLYNVVTAMADIQQSFKYRLDQIFKTKTWGVIISNPKDDKILYSLNADIPLIPASNQKIITLLASLEKMNLDYRNYTEFYKQGVIENQSLKGDLIIKGKGALYFTARYPLHNSINKKNKILGKQLDSFVNELHKNNIKSIQGRIIIDNSDWTDDEVNSHYRAAGALTFNENTYDIEVRNRKYFTSPERVIGVLLKENYQIRFQEMAGFSEDGMDIININLSHDSIDYWRLNRYNSNHFYLNQIKAGLKERGIEIREDDLRTSIKEEVLLFKLYGVSLKDYIEPLLKYSDNLRAELLFLNLGYLLYGKANYKNGRDAVLNVINTLGLKLKSFSPYDGSGLDLRNKISARDNITILNFIYKSRWYELFKNNLAQSGMSGTLKNYLKDSRVKGKIFAKSGTHDNLKALSGFVEGKTKTISFTFIGNFEEEMNAIPVLEQAALVLVDL